MRIIVNHLESILFANTASGCRETTCVYENSKCEKLDRTLWILLWCTLKTSVYNQIQASTSRVV